MCSKLNWSHSGGPHKTSHRVRSGDSMSTNSMSHTHFPSARVVQKTTHQHLRCSIIFFFPNQHGKVKKKTAMQLTNSLQKSYVVTEATSQTQKSFNCSFPFQQWIWHTPTSTQLLLHLTFFPIQPRNLASQASRDWLEVALLLAIGPQWIRWNYDGWIVPRGGFKNSTLSES